MRLNTYRFLFLLVNAISVSSGKIGFNKQNVTSKTKTNYVLLGGEEDVNRTFEFVVKVGELGHSGVLIAPKWVLSEVLCLTDEVTIYGGGYGELAERRKIDKIIISDDYSTFGKGNLLGLAKLTEPFKSRVNFAKLPVDPWEQGGIETCNLVGYGRTYDINSKSLEPPTTPNFRIVDVGRTSLKCGCRSEELIGVRVCYVSDENEGPCVDAGAPLVCDGVVKALYSYHGPSYCSGARNIPSGINYHDATLNRCGVKGVTRIFAEIGSHIDWILVSTYEEPCAQCCTRSNILLQAFLIFYTLKHYYIN